MKYYIYESGEFWSTARFAGNFEDMSEAKEKLFDEMGNGDKIVEFPEGFYPEFIDNFGYETVSLDEATDVTELRRSDGTIEGIPAGVWYWTDEEDNCDWEFYNSAIQILIFIIRDIKKVIGAGGIILLG